MREGMKIIRTGLVNAISNFSDVATQYKNLATLGYTHYQAAQPVTIGKRFMLYVQDFIDLVEELDNVKFRARGAKGTVGTQASFMKLFGNDNNKVRRLDELVAQKLGFETTYHLTSQTYPRSFDAKIVSLLNRICISLAKFGNDMRLMSHDNIVDEPFEEKQTGSSAMVFKRNPMRSERLCSIARHLIGLSVEADITATTQWLERTLDDSAIRRIYVPESFLSTDAVLILANNITTQNMKEGTRPLTFYKGMIKRTLDEQLPFLAIEDIIMELVSRGGNRQELHEIFREHSVNARIDMLENGKTNDLLERIADDERVPMNLSELQPFLHPDIGRAREQVDEYMAEVVTPFLIKNAESIGKSNSEINV